MKKKMIGFVMVLVVCLGAAVPAAAVEPQNAAIRIPGVNAVLTLEGVYAEYFYYFSDFERRPFYTFFLVDGGSVSSDTPFSAGAAIGSFAGGMLPEVNLAAGEKYALTEEGNKIGLTTYARPDGTLFYDVIGLMEEVTVIDFVLMHGDTIASEFPDIETRPISGLAGASQQPAAPETITITLGGSAIPFPDQLPAIVDGRTLVPIAPIVSAMGGSSAWDGDTRTATITLEDTVLSITIDSAIMLINGNSFELDVPAAIMEGRTMVPLRAISEGFGFDVGWDGPARTASISRP